MRVFTIFFVLALHLMGVSCGGKPCQARQIPGRSVVCVCTAEYCDEFVRQAPAKGRFVTYTSSEAGARFVTKSRVLQGNDNSVDSGAITISLDPNVKYQTVEGFGGAVTDAAGINWKSLADERLQKYLIDSYFSKSGLEYNMLRVPIGGSDFSTRPYAYNEEPRDDVTLSNFNLAPEDFLYKISMIKEIMNVSVEPIHIVATTWSPPVWMKTNEVYGDISQLKPKYYQTYADYHIKFIEEYAKQGIPIWGITTTNEPLNGIFGWAGFNSLGWKPGNLGTWIANNLGPTVRNSSFFNLKILCHDDQRATLPYYVDLMLSAVPEAFSFIDGVAVHYYTDLFISPKALDVLTETLPDKFILATEACEGSSPFDTDKVSLGNWDRAKAYAIDIIEDLASNVVGWIDWNLCLDAQGGPNWAENFVDSPIIVYPERNEFIKQPMFYALGHFSKFIPRGSRRIKVTETKPFWSSKLYNVAFLTPYNTIVVVLYNDDVTTKVSIVIGQKKATLWVDARSLVTVEIPCNTSMCRRRPPIVTMQ